MEMEEWLSSLLRKPDKFLEYQSLLYEECQTMEKYYASEKILKDRIDTTMLKSILNDEKISNPKWLIGMMFEDEAYATAGYPLGIKSMTWRGKSSICEHYTQNMNLLQMLEVDLTSRGKDLRPFWTTQSEEISKRLWLPTKTDFVGSDMNWSTTSSLNIAEGKSWFSIVHHTPLKLNSQMTYFRCLPYSPQESMDPGNINVRSKKIRLFPNKEQIKILTEWFGISRWFYNRTIDYIEDRCRHKLKFQTFISTRNSIRNNKTHEYDIPDWCKIPVCPRVISGAIQDCHGAYSNAIKAVKERRIHSFKVHYRTKKDINQSIFMEKTCFGRKNNESILKSFFKTPIIGIYRRRTRVTNSKRRVIRLRDISKINPDGKDCRLVSEDHGRRYYLIIPMDVKVDESQVNSNIISLDSGIRTFQTGYSPSGHVIELGVNTGDKLVEHLSKQDVLRSLISKSKCNRMKRRYWKSYRKQSRRITNLVRDLHWKCANYLTKNYGMIVMSDFRVSELFKLKRLNKQSKRIMAVQSHYKFKQRLMSKCADRNVRLCIVDESYTSKTCTNCGNLHTNLGGSKTYICSKCSINLDRDVNGARNIFIKNFSIFDKFVQYGVSPVTPYRCDDCL